MPRQTKSQPIKPAGNSQQKKIATSTGANARASAESQQLSEVAVTRKRGSIYPCWNVWRMRTSILLWEAVALSKNINPAQLPMIKEKYPIKYSNYRTRLKTAKSWLNAGLKIQDHPDNGTVSDKKMVMLAEFVRCAVAMKMQITPRLLEITSAADERSSRPTDAQSLPSNHESKNLIQRNERLQEAANKLAHELGKTKKTGITRRLIAEKLHKGEWGDMTAVSIERNIRVQWK